MDTLETPRLILRCPRAGDGAAVNAAIRASWPELNRWMEWAQGAPPSIDDTEARMAERPAHWAARDDFSFALWCRETHRCLGLCSIFALDWDVPKGEIGYWLHSEATGQGLMTEAAGAVTQFAVQRLGLVRVEIRCDDRNARSAAVAERLGYSLEGTLRSECRDPQGTLRDTRLYAWTIP
jgi:RimJ/RimL family protein N-acetyltransferase